jgi:ABC-2 type transport system ATP-binding protein
VAVLQMHAPLAAQDPSAHVAALSVPAIEMVDLRKRFGRFQALSGLSLTINQGEIFGLLGPNGSGKSTTINVISGLMAPSAGTVRVLGYDVGRHPHKIRQRLGVVSQETALYEELTAWANLDFHADLYGVPRQEKWMRIISMLDLVQLTERAHTRVKTFSGGMKRRLAIARALLHDPQLLYLDEPSLGVDIQSRNAIWAYIRALKGQGKTILLTTNYLEEAQALCDRLAILDHGQVLVVASPAELKTRYGGQVAEVTLAEPRSSVEDLARVPGVQHILQDEARLRMTLRGEETGSALATVLSLLAAEGTILKVAVREPHLDEIFLRLTGTALRD